MRRVVAGDVAAAVKLLKRLGAGEQALDQNVISPGRLTWLLVLPARWLRREDFGRDLV